MRTIAQEINKLDVIAAIRKLVMRYPMYSHSALAVFLNKVGEKPLIGERWSTKNLKGFMQRNGIAHKTDELTAQSVIKENRPEAMRLI